MRGEEEKGEEDEEGEGRFLKVPVSNGCRVRTYREQSKTFKLLETETISLHAGTVGRSFL